MSEKIDSGALAGGGLRAPQRGLPRFRPDGKGGVRRTSSGSIPSGIDPHSTDTQRDAGKPPTVLLDPGADNRFSPNLFPNMTALGAQPNRRKEDAPAKRIAQWRGRTIHIEHEAGDIRHPEGPFSTLIPHGIAYGYFKDLKGEDGDSLDVIMRHKPIQQSAESPPANERVFICAQCHPETGAFLQHKVMLGFSSPAEAESAYKMLWPPKMFAGLHEVAAEHFTDHVLPKLDVSKGVQTNKGDGVEIAKQLPTAEQLNTMADATIAELVQWHWDLHLAFTSQQTAGVDAGQLAEQHARVADGLFERGVEHPPPPDDGLDLLSNPKEVHAEQQPHYFEQSVATIDGVPDPFNNETMDQQARTKQALFELSGVALLELRKFLLPSIELALADFTDFEKAVWSTAYQNDLPDSAFLYVESGGSKDAAGKTTPRSLRHFPYKDQDGKIDLPHLRNALARIPQSSLPQNVKDAAIAAAQRHLGDTTKAVSKNYEARLEFPILKIDAEERLITGVVLEPDEVDAQNDTVKPEIIKAAAHRFMANYGRTDGSRLGLMHKQFGDVGFQLAESWIAPADMTIGEEKVKKGSWLMTVKAVSDALWASVKAGKLTGFSIGGIAAIA